MKAEKRAFEAYPSESDAFLDRFNYECRKAYVEGYEQAEKDICEWLSNNFWSFYDKDTGEVNLSGLIYHIREGI